MKQSKKKRSKNLKYARVIFLVIIAVGISVFLIQNSFFENNTMPDEKKDENAVLDYYLPEGLVQRSESIQQENASKEYSEYNVTQTIYLEEEPKEKSPELIAQENWIVNETCTENSKDIFNEFGYEINLCCISYETDFDFEKFENCVDSALDGAINETEEAVPFDSCRDMILIRDIKGFDYDSLTGDDEDCTAYYYGDYCFPIVVHISKTETTHEAKEVIYFNSQSDEWEFIEFNGEKVLYGYTKYNKYDNYRWRTGSYIITIFGFSRIKNTKCNGFECVVEYYLVTLGNSINSIK